jgi:hypothetical protein
VVFVLLRMFPYLMAASFLIWVSYVTGNAQGESKQRALCAERADQARELRCFCGDIRSCAFGGGVVGIQKCDNVSNQWLRCEPNPQYCDNACLRLKVDAYRQADLLNSKP